MSENFAANLAWPTWSLYRGQHINLRPAVGNMLQAYSTEEGGENKPDTSRRYQSYGMTLWTYTSFSLKHEGSIQDDETTPVIFFFIYVVF